MAQINKPTDYFNTKLYTGNGSTQSITGVGFQPDWVWLKDRTSAYNHVVFDKVRGVEKRIFPNLTNAEDTAADTLTAFNSDGFAIGSNVGINTNTNNYVSWNWLADNTSGSSNTDGSITSTVSANTTSGFSIVSWTGSGANATIGHGLSTTPSMIIAKSRSASGGWYTYHKSIGATKFLQLSTTDASATNSTIWNNTEPTSSFFSTGTAFDNGTTYIAYCFAEVKGFSKFSSYVGNGSTDGAFVYTGFKPKLVIVKEYGATGNWIMKESRFDNQNDSYILANASDAEASGSVVGFDLLSNGFKLRGTAGDSNGAGADILYMAFAEEPLVGDNPATAR